MELAFVVEYFSDICFCECFRYCVNGFRYFQLRLKENIFLVLY